MGVSQSKAEEIAEKRADNVRQEMKTAIDAKEEELRKEIRSSKVASDKKTRELHEQMIQTNAATQQRTKELQDLIHLTTLEAIKRNEVQERRAERTQDALDTLMMGISNAFHINTSTLNCDTSATWDTWEAPISSEAVTVRW